MDPNIKSIREDIASELGVRLGQVDEALDHFFSWQRNSFTKLEYAEYKWNKFGKFEYFNLNKSDKDNSKVVKGYTDTKKVKDIYLKEDIEITKDHQDIINKLIKMDPCLLKTIKDKKLKRFGYCIKGDTNDYGWNINVLKISPISDIRLLINTLNNLNT